MSARKKKSETVETVTLEASEAVEEAAEAAETVEETAEASEPVVYIGTDIKHVARKGTVYSNGLPKALEAKIEETPAIRGLIVPTSKLATAQETMARQGTALNNLFEAVREKLNKK